MATNKYSPWKNKAKEDDSDLTLYKGFTYKITEISTGIKYYGIKKLWTIPKRKYRKGSRKTLNTIKETNWRTYNTSSIKMQDRLKSNPSNYKKEIIYFHKSISEMKAREAFIVLSYYYKNKYDEIYNEMVHLRVRLRKCN